MDGASVTAFSPDGHVTREQAAAILMRLHDKLHEPTTSRIGIAVAALFLGIFLYSIKTRKVSPQYDTLKK